jgi:transketolase C-terminal domain/subunit
MYTIRTDKSKNRIYITLGAIDTGEGETLVAGIKDETANLTPGFTCVSDITRFSVLDPREAVWADQALKTLADAGMARAIRVTGRKTEYRETREKYGYMIGLAETIEEADRILDTL